jgi:hypothetical protein
MSSVTAIATTNMAAMRPEVATAGMELGAAGMGLATATPPAAKKGSAVAAAEMAPAVAAAATAAAVAAAKMGAAEPNCDCRNGQYRAQNRNQ